MSSVRAENATKDYPLGRATAPALRGVSLSVERAELSAVAGLSGSGKSTLLNLIGCLDHPTSGRVVIDGHEPTADLDSTTGDAIVALVEEIDRREGTTFIFSTHDPRVMGRAHRVLRLADGRLEA